MTEMLTSRSTQKRALQISEKKRKEGGIQLPTVLPMLVFLKAHYIEVFRWMDE